MFADIPAAGCFLAKRDFVLVSGVAPPSVAPPSVTPSRGASRCAATKTWMK